MAENERDHLTPNFDDVNSTDQTHTVSVCIGRVLFSLDQDQKYFCNFVRLISTQFVSLYLLENSSSWFSLTVSSSLVLIFTKSMLQSSSSKSSLYSISLLLYSIQAYSIKQND